MEIVFCDKCGKRIGAKDIAAGRVAKTPSGALCPECAPQAPAEGKPTGQTAAIRLRAARNATSAGREEAAPRQAPVGSITVGSVGAGRDRPRAQVEPAGEPPAPQPGAPKPAEGAGGGMNKGYIIVLAAVVGMIAAAILFWPSKEKPLAGAAGAGVTAPPAVVADNSPAKLAFDEAVTFSEVNAADFRGQAERFKKICDDFPGTDWAAKASERVKAAEAKLPLQLYAEMAETVRTVTAEGRYSDATKLIKDYLEKYPGGEASEKAAGALSEVADRAATDAELAIARSKSDLSRGDLAGAEAKLKELDDWGIEKVSALVAAARKDMEEEKKKREAAAAEAAKVEAEGPEEYKKLETAWSRREYDEMERLTNAFRDRFSKTEYFKTKQAEIVRMEKDAANWRDVKAKEKDVITDGSRAEIFYRVDFDDGRPKGWSNGDIVDEPGRGKVYQAKRNVTQWFECRIGSDWRPDIPIAKEGYLSFYYYLSAELPDPVYMYMTNTTKDHNGFSLYWKGKWAPEIGKWTFFGISLKEFAGGKDNFDEPDICSSLTFTFNKFPEGTIFKLDEVTITKGGYPTLIKLQIERAEQHRKEMTADPKSAPWFYLNPDVCRKLRLIDRKTKEIGEKSILVAGSGLAAKSSFVGPLARMGLKGEDGYKFHPPLSAASPNKGIEEMKDKIAAAVTRLKPEVTVIAIDPADITAARGAPQVQAAFLETVTKTLEAGSVPILVTLALPRVPDPKVQAEVTAYNVMVLDAAKKLGVPALDAWSLLNSEEAQKKGSFSGTDVKLSGYNLLNDSMLDLYKRLEKFVFDRGPAEPPLAVPTPERPERPETPAAPVNREPGAAPPPPPSGGTETREGESPAVPPPARIVR